MQVHSNAAKKSANCKLSAMTGCLPGARRRVIAGLFAGMALPFAVWSQTYPSKPIRVVIPFPAGSSPDVIARFWGSEVFKALGQPVVIDNRPGAGTIIGTQAVTTAPADGYTLLFTTVATTSINPYVFKSLPYKVEDLTPITPLVSSSFVLITGANSPFKTSQDLFRAAKAKPGGLNYASYGIGQGTHVLMARLLNTSSVSMTHVPYKDGGITDIVSGSIDASFEPATTATALIKGGRVRGLGVTSPKRLAVLPDVPALSETIPGFTADAWIGLFAPKGVPAEAINVLASISQKIARSSEFRAKVAELGVTPLGNTQAEFQKMINDDSGIWSKVVRDNDIKVD